MSTNFKKSEEKLIPAPIPLPDLERGNFDENSSIALRFETPKIDIVKLLEARKNATPKSVYAGAILAHCQECFGKSPAREDCGGDKLSDGTACNLYRHNSAKKCRRSTKTALKKAIRNECRYCFGESRRLDLCTSPNCQFYDLGRS